MQSSKGCLNYFALGIKFDQKCTRAEFLVTLDSRELQRRSNGLQGQQTTL